MTPATQPNGQSMKKYGQQILNGASISERNIAGGGPQRPAARASHENAALSCLQQSQAPGCAIVCLKPAPTDLRRGTESGNLVVTPMSIVAAP